MSASNSVLQRTLQSIGRGLGKAVRARREAAEIVELAAWRPRRRLARSGQAPFARKALFEAMEPRMLLSADISPLHGVPSPGPEIPAEVLELAPEALPAEPLVLFPSVTSTASLDPKVTFLPLDAPTVALGGELTSEGALSASVLVPPAGSLVYTQVTTDSFEAAGETDSILADLDAGQTLSVVFTPGSGIQGALSVTDPGGTEIGSGSASAADQPVVLQTLPVASAGTYSIDVESLAGTGDYRVQLWLNTHVELETYGGAANDALGSAEDISASSLVLPNGGERMAVVGATGGSGPDYFSFTAGAGDVLTLALTSTEGQASLGLSLMDESGALLTLGQAGQADNVDSLIRGLVTPVAGTYAVAVYGAADQDYSLVVLRNADFDLEPNGRADDAQALFDGDSVLGHVGGDSEGGGVSGGGTIQVAVFRGPSN
jgi:hypothetical protein